MVSNVTLVWDSNNLPFVGSFIHLFIRCMFLEPLLWVQSGAGAGESDVKKAQWSWVSSSLWLRDTGRWACPRLGFRC